MSEHDEQAFIIEWADLQANLYPDLSLLYAVPNGAKLPWKKDKNGNRYSPEAKRLKAEGLRSGVPDLVLPVPRKGFHGLYVELKVGSNRPGENQIWWLDQLSKQGYLAVVCYGADDAIDTIKDYLEISQ